MPENVFKVSWLDSLKPKRVKIPFSAFLPNAPNFCLYFDVSSVCKVVFVFFDVSAICYLKNNPLLMDQLCIVPSDDNLLGTLLTKLRTLRTGPML